MEIFKKKSSVQKGAQDPLLAKISEQQKKERDAIWGQLKEYDVNFDALAGDRRMRSIPHESQGRTTLVRLPNGTDLVRTDGEIRTTVTFAKMCQSIGQSVLTIVKKDRHGEELGRRQHIFIGEGMSTTSSGTLEYTNNLESLTEPLVDLNDHLASLSKLGEKAVKSA